MCGHYSNKCSRSVYRGDIELTVYRGDTRLTVYGR